MIDEAFRAIPTALPVIDGFGNRRISGAAAGSPEGAAHRRAAGAAPHGRAQQRSPVLGCRGNTYTVHRRCRGSAALYRRRGRPHCCYCACYHVGADRRAAAAGRRTEAGAEHGPDGGAAKLLRVGVICDPGARLCGELAADGVILLETGNGCSVRVLPEPAAQRLAQRKAARRTRAVATAMSR
jgi:hypothetical protein